MYRGHSAPSPGPGQPMLHHPVPQHVIPPNTIRSPPIAMGGYDSPYVPQQPAGPGANPYASFLGDPTTQMGVQMGRTAMAAGSSYVEQNFGKYMSGVSTGALKHYFNVSNQYVVKKLYIVLIPWRHRPWARVPVHSSAQQGPTYLPPREDVNSPDMYIPLMAFVTYILLSTSFAGLAGNFHPELLGVTASKAFAVVIFEILGLKLGCYLLNISGSSQLLDLVAYSGYKFVGIIVNLIAGHVFSRSIAWIVFAYTFLANAFFLLRSLKYVVLPDNSDTNRGTMYGVARAQKNRRTQFLFIYSYIVQLFCMWLLS